MLNVISRKGGYAYTACQSGVFRRFCHTSMMVRQDGKKFNAKNLIVVKVHENTIMILILIISI